MLGYHPPVTIFQDALMLKHSFRLETAAHRFESFLEKLLLALDLADAVADGVHELPTTRGAVALALSRDHQFVAARFADGTEAFFVCPAAKEPRCGLTLWAADPPLWWVTFAGGALSTVEYPNPSFLQLTCLLASNGQLVSNGPDTVRLQALSSEVDYLQALLREQGDDLRRAKAALRDLVGELASGDPREPTVEGIEPPADLAELATWCSQHEEQIVVLPRARKGAKKSVYERPEHIFEALALLAGPYRDLRLGRLEPKDFEQILRQSSVSLEGSVSPSVAGEQGDAYFVLWGGRRRFLELHVLKGGGRSERFCMRVYFFWDEVSERVVVGAMPRHLENSLT